MNSRSAKALDVGVAIVVVAAYAVQAQDFQNLQINATAAYAANAAIGGL